MPGSKVQLLFLTFCSFLLNSLSVKMEFVNGHFDNTLTAIDESNIWWTVFSDACKGMDVDYETEIFPGKARVAFFFFFVRIP